MIETKTKTIDGYQIAVTQLPAKRAMRLFHRLSQIGIPGFVQSMGSLASGADTKVDFASVGKSLEGVMQALDVDTFESVRDELLYAATIDGKTLLDLMDVELAGKIATVYRIMLFALESNYSDFLGVFRGAVARLAVLTPASS